MQEKNKKDRCKNCCNDNCNHKEHHEECDTRKHHHGDGDEDCGCKHHHGGNHLMYARIVTALISGVLIYILSLSDWLYLIPYFILGYDVLISSVKNIFKGELFDEEFLMSIATIGALALGNSVEACAVMLFYQAGEIISHETAEKCRLSIKKMFDFAPDFARKITESGFQTVSPESLKVNDRISVFAGEKIPCDGYIYSGESHIDTSSLTGESLPLRGVDGTAVKAGYLNLDAPIEVRITGEYRDSSVAKVVRMLEEASKNKAKSEKFISSFAKKYTPIVVLSAILAAILLPFTKAFTINSAIYAALMFLVISCPCSLVISVPLTLFAGVGNASKNKILFKGNGALERLYKIKNYAFDKTGTLTNAKFEISENTLSDECFTILSQTERYSTHPLAVVLAAKKSDESITPKGVFEIKGMGITAEIDGKKVVCGNEKMMEFSKINNYQRVSGTVIHLAIDGDYKGYVKLSDGIKSETRDVIRKLKNENIRITLLSGDNETAVGEVAHDLGIDKFEFGMLPEDKVKAANELKKKSPLAFVGDGINDAPILAISDIGISMGGAGSDIAIANSDVILLDDSLESLLKARSISKKTMSIVYQNIILSITLKFIVMILSLFGIGSMTSAVFADVGVMILTVLNSIRAMK